MESNKLFHILLLFSLLLSIAMADTLKAKEEAKPSAEGTVQIVYMERTSENDDAETAQVKTLANVLGSEEAAKNAILYSYKHTVNGFSAKLTPEQIEALSKQPGVLQIIPSQTYQLHKGPGMSAT